MRLAAHPDDPPLPTLRQTARLVYKPELYQRLLDIAPSHANALEFCQGTISEMDGEMDVYEAIDRYAGQQKIAYVHFRNVRGKVPNYREVFIDEGDVDMIRAPSLPAPATIPMSSMPHRGCTNNGFICSRIKPCCEHHRGMMSTMQLGEMVNYDGVLVPPTTRRASHCESAAMGREQPLAISASAGMAYALGYMRAAITMIEGE